MDQVAKLWLPGGNPALGLGGHLVTDGPIDRRLQRALLLAMRDCYPELMRSFPDGVGDDPATDANLLYLEEHGLCDAGLSQNMSGGYGWRGSKITARGLDFLAEDGGLTAILGIVTVRLDASTVRELISAKIDTSQLPETERTSLKQRLATLSETALKAATTDLVTTGLNHLPDAAHWLRTVAGL